MPAMLTNDFQALSAMMIELDGTDIFMATGGQPLRPELPSVVLIHGAGLDHSVWALQSRWFSYHGRNVIAPDLPGHGRSGGAPLATIADMGDWISTVLATLGIAQAALAGHSMGTLVALETAHRHPAKVRALGLIGASTAIPVHPDIIAAAAGNRHEAIEMLAIWGTGFAAGLGGCLAPGLWMLGGAEKLWERAAPGVLHADLAACAAYRDGPAAAASITCPTIIVQGRSDAMTPLRGAQALAKTIAGAKLTVLEGAGHMLLTERPDDVLAALATL
jgi:pimeloyl-ACP methyl ester carboxylesterase